MKLLNFSQRNLNYSHISSNKITICPHGGFTIPGKNGYTMGGILKLIKKPLRERNFYLNGKVLVSGLKNKIDSLSQKILGDAHNSIDFSDILYLSDTLVGAGIINTKM